MATKKKTTKPKFYKKEVVTLEDFGIQGEIIEIRAVNKSGKIELSGYSFGEKLCTELTSNIKDILGAISITNVTAKYFDADGNEIKKPNGLVSGVQDGAVLELNGYYVKFSDVSTKAVNKILVEVYQDKRLQYEEARWTFRKEDLIGALNLAAS